jgi:hypothetical protein
VDSTSVVAKLLEANQARGRSDDENVEQMAAAAYAGISDHPTTFINS